jgi:hypothetical protein
MMRGFPICQDDLSTPAGVATPRVIALGLIPPAERRGPAGALFGVASDATLDQTSTSALGAMAQ